MVKAFWLFSGVGLNEFAYYKGKVRINGQQCNISASKVKNKQGKPELQVIAPFNRPTEANEIYKERWQIETTLSALKSSGFNIEDTHLTDIERINKLLSLVFVAFIWIYKIGIELDELIPIKIKKQERMAKSLFKYGLEFITNVIYTNDLYRFKLCCNFLSCT
jgi:transposase